MLAVASVDSCRRLLGSKRAQLEARTYTEGPDPEVRRSHGYDLAQTGGRNVERDSGCLL